MVRTEIIKSPQKDIPVIALDAHLCQWTGNFTLQSQETKKEIISGPAIERVEKIDFYKGKTGDLVAVTMDIEWKSHAIALFEISGLIFIQDEPAQSDSFNE